MAVRDYTEAFALAAFYDDFTFSHFSYAPTGISAVAAEMGADAAVTVYNLNGMKMAQGKGMDTLKNLEKGIYVVKVQSAEGTKTLKVARK